MPDAQGTHPALFPRELKGPCYGYNALDAGKVTIVSIFAV
jgi:hypothetical protein